MKNHIHVFLQKVVFIVISICCLVSAVLADDKVPSDSASSTVPTEELGKSVHPTAEQSPLDLLDPDSMTVGKK